MLVKLKEGINKIAGEMIFAHEIEKEVSPHWPGVGKYIGAVDDEKLILFDNGEDFNIFDYYDKNDWQKRRVYWDEIPLKKKLELEIGRSYYDKKENRFIQIRGIDNKKDCFICGFSCIFLNDSKTVIKEVNHNLSKKYIIENFVYFDDPQELSIYEVSKPYADLSHKIKEN